MYRLIEGLPRLQGKRRRWLISSIVVIAAVAVVIGAQSYYYREPVVPGESIGSVPDGHVSDLLWHGEYLYFFSEPHGLDNLPQLWRIKPGGTAEEVRLADSRCSIDAYSSLAEWSDGELILVRECDANSDEVVKVHPETGVTERIAMFGNSSPVISDIDRVADVVLVSRDAGWCSGIARLDGEAFMPAPPLKTKTETLDLGGPFQGQDDNCVGYSPAKFVTPVGRSVAILASSEAVGVPTSDRDGLNWSIYLAGTDWANAERLTDGFEAPVQMASLKDCGLLVAATRDGSSGIWLVDRNGDIDQVVEGDLTDFAVQPDGEAIAVLNEDLVPVSFHLVRHPFKDKPICGSGTHF